MSAVNFVDDEDAIPTSKRHRMTSTPEVEHTEISPSPSFSSVYEFPLSGECVDKTIEIGSNGDECSSSEELMFLSDSEVEECQDNCVSDSVDCDGDDSIIYPSDLASESDDESSSETTSGATSTTSTGTDTTSESTDRDIQSELIDVGATLVSGCCQQLCLLSLTPKAVLAYRRKLHSLTSNARRQWIADKVFESSNLAQQGKIEVQFTLSGVNVCNTAWCKIYQISGKKLARVRRDVAQGLITVQHGNKGKKRNYEKSETAKTWMERYFHLVGDKMPHNGQIHLPSWEKQKDVYERYQSDMSQQQLTSQDIVCLSTFYKIWAAHFPKVVIPGENRFAKCDICVKLKLERKDCLNKDQQKLLRAKLEEHLKRVEKERKKYHSHREKARATPDKNMCIIIDGMDQAKTNLPNTKHIAKSTSGLWHLRTHVTGILVHTRAPHGKLALAFIDTVQFPHDSNLTLTLLLKALVFCSKQRGPSENLYIQMDNTSRENKNRYTLAFCALLVTMKIFKKVQINFLPVGHTHEDIDQLFSKIGDEIQHKGSESLPDLLQAIQSSYTPSPNAKLVESVWDFKKWLEPHIPRLEQHSRYLVYRFTLNDGRAQMHYKRFSDMPWEPTGNGVTILYGSPDVADPPEFVTPCGDKMDPERLAIDLPKYKPYLSQNSWQNWEEFLANLENIDSIHPQPWILPELLSASIRASVQRKENEESNPSISQATQTLLEKEITAPPPITAKPKRGQKTIAQTCNPTPANISPEIMETSNLPDLAIGHIVAFKTSTVDEAPWLGRCTAVGEDEIEVLWLEGGWTREWKEARIRKGRKLEEWRDTVCKDSIILYAIELTKTNRLKAATIKYLKEQYSKLCDQ